MGSAKQAGDVVLRAVDRDVYGSPWILDGSQGGEQHPAQRPVSSGLSQ
jgi:hypothetical protein